MNQKVYLSIIKSYFECGDESYSNEYILGVFDNPVAAHEAGWRYVYENFQYDEETNTYYGECANEAWASVLEFTMGAEEGGVPIQETTHAG